MVMLSTATKFASASTMPPTHSIPPVSGAGCLSSIGRLDMTGPFRSCCKERLRVATSGRGGRCDLLRVAAQIDFGIHGQSDSKRMGRQFVGIQADAHRQALHDLDPVTGRVLRRNQREGGTGAAVESFNDTVEGDLVAIEVGYELDLLAGAHHFQLYFLEIGVYIFFAYGDHREERRGGLDALAELDLPSGDDAVNWRANDGTAEIDIRLLDARLGERHRRVGSAQ